MKVEADIRTSEARIAPRSGIWQHGRGDIADWRNRPRAGIRARPLYGMALCNFMRMPLWCDKAFDLYFWSSKGSMMKLPIKMFALSASMLVALALLSLGESRELISPRELGLALLALSAVGGIWAVHIIGRSAKDAASVDAISRKRRVLGVQIGSAVIVVLVLLLIFGLLQGGPWLPRLIGAMVNLAIIAAISRVLIRLQRSLR